jgi:hypothetical protein
MSNTGEKKQDWKNEFQHLLVRINLDESIIVNSLHRRNAIYQSQENKPARIKGRKSFNITTKEALALVLYQALYLTASTLIHKLTESPTI